MRPLSHKGEILETCHLQNCPARLLTPISFPAGKVDSNVLCDFLAKMWGGCVPAFGRKVLKVSNTVQCHKLAK
jgi:hypothetical protein